MQASMQFGIIKVTPFKVSPESGCMQAGLDADIITDYRYT